MRRSILHPGTSLSLCFQRPEVSREGAKIGYPLMGLKGRRLLEEYESRPVNLSPLPAP